MAIRQETEIFKTYSIDDPAAGAEFLLQPASDKAWRVVGLRTTLSSDPTGVNRFPGVRMIRGSDTLLLTISSAGQGPNENLAHFFNAGQTATNDRSAENIMTHPMSDSMWIYPGTSIFCEVVNLQAADQLTDVAVAVLEYDVIASPRRDKTKD